MNPLVGNTYVATSLKLLTTLLLLLALTATANADEFQSLFNGRDLSGWAGNLMTVEFKDIRLRTLEGNDAKDAIDDLSVKAGSQATPVDRIKAAEGFQVELL